MITKDTAYIDDEADCEPYYYYVRYPANGIF